MRVRRIYCLNDLGTMPLNSRKQLWNKNNDPFPWQHNSPKRKGGIRDSIPRQVDKRRRVPKERGSGVPDENIGVWNSQGGGKDKLFFFFSTFLSLSHMKHFFISLNPELMITHKKTIQFKLCTRDYITTMYPA